MREPARVGRPCTSKRFFTAKGTPASGHGVAVAVQRLGAGERALGQHAREGVDAPVGGGNAPGSPARAPPRCRA
jgi:hypothetical protein